MAAICDEEFRTRESKTVVDVSKTLGIWTHFGARRRKTVVFPWIVRGVVLADAEVVHDSPDDSLLCIASVYSCEYIGLLHET